MNAQGTHGFASTARRFGWAGSVREGYFASFFTVTLRM